MISEWDKLTPFEKSVLELLRLILHNTGREGSAGCYRIGDPEDLVNSYAEEALDADD